jgi:hypothetical protein
VFTRNNRGIIGRPSWSCHLLFYWEPLSEPQWTGGRTGTAGWKHVMVPKDLPAAIRSSPCLISRLGRTSYWVGSLYPAILVSTNSMGARSYITALVLRGFEDWWSLHKGRSEDTGWRQRALWKNSSSPSSPTVPRSLTTSRLPALLTAKWKPKNRVRMFGPHANGGLDTIIAWGFYAFLGPESYSACRLTGPRARQCLDDTMQQLRKAQESERYSYYLNDTTLRDTLVASPSACLLILSSILKECPTLFQACRVLQTLELRWETPLRHLSQDLECLFIAATVDTPRGARPRTTPVERRLYALNRSGEPEDSGNDFGEDPHSGG